MRLFALLLLAAPLSAQQTVIVPNVDVAAPNVTNEVTVNVPPLDSALVAAQIARDEAAIRQMEIIAAYFEDCGCTSQGGSRATQVATGGIALFLGLIWWELRKGSKDGIDGAPGKDGKDGADGQDGIHGRIGHPKPPPFSDDEGSES